MFLNIGIGRTLCGIKVIFIFIYFILVIPLLTMQCSSILYLYWKSNRALNDIKFMRMDIQKMKKCVTQ